MRGDGTPAREATEALAAESEPDYVHALPERYRRKWERSGIGERVQEVTRQTRTSLKARLSFTPEKHVEAAVRKECGGEAQRLDREMREEMQQDRRLWDVLRRMDTLQYEESRAADERVAGESLERARSGVPQSEQGPELEPPSSLPAIAQPILAGIPQDQPMPGAAPTPPSPARRRGGEKKAPRCLDGSLTLPPPLDAGSGFRAGGPSDLTPPSGGVAWGRTTDAIWGRPADPGRVRYEHP